ncbi:hypothetical protein HNQ60_005105 [Povalibacter uvarum]|uniref:Uncharacterized protein n=1 Tax=Povalibacter uvarum TaxID=732238 RepID=A0A841HTR2_9GAMM|nr:hypothetical protein [Povalibacter uvarum]
MDSRFCRSEGTPHSVIPAKAGIHLVFRGGLKAWTPAFEGVTKPFAGATD